MPVLMMIIKGRTFVEGIENVYNKVKGSCSMLLLTEHGVIAARDSWGRTPIVVGKKEGAMAVSTESTAFPNLDYETTYYIGPGEIVRSTADGMEQLRKPNEKMQVCAFMWVYYGFPTGVPDSGVGMATGYAAGRGVPYLRCIAKYTPTWPRSFMPPSQEMRNLVAKMKLIANRDLLKGKRLLCCDDSIVRGTQLRDNTKVLFDDGAKEVHMRIACPPLVYGCRFIGFTSSKSDMELITRRVIQDFEGENPSEEVLRKYTETDSPQYQRMVNEIAKRLNLTSLKFTKLEDLVKAIGLPKCKICTHCFDGSSAFTLTETNK